MSANTTTPNDTRTAQETALWQALTAQPGASAVELSRAASVPKSAVSKILGHWAGDGRIVRANNGDDRSGFRWRIADQVDATETSSPATEPDAQPTPVEPEPSEPTPTDASADRETVEASEAAETSSPETEPDTQPTVSEPVPSELTPSEVEAVVATPIEGVCPTCGQRPKGQPRESQSGVLRGKVEDFFREHPGEEFTPGQIAKALGGKSSGAVYNACFALVGKFVAEYTCERPNKFRLHPDQAKAQAQEAQPQP